MLGWVVVIDREPSVSFSSIILCRLLQIAANLLSVIWEIDVRNARNW